MANYRKIYADYYGIKIPKDMDIHHIDGNRENNDITNLLMLPRELHQRYHRCRYEADCVLPSFNGKLVSGNQFNVSVLTEYSEVLNECMHWVGEKAQLGVRKWIREGVPPHG